MKIYEILSNTDLPTYQKIIKIYGFNPNSTEKKEVESKPKYDPELGDSIENLMSHSAYKRGKGGAIRQTRFR